MSPAYGNIVYAERCVGHATRHHHSKEVLRTERPTPTQHPRFGIQSNPQRRGVYLLQDGIPVNFADGSYIIGVMDYMTAHFVEVFKGANA